MTTADRHFTHLVWVKDQKNRLYPQLWTEDLTRTKPHTPVRQDLMRHIADRTVKVFKLKADEAQITLDEAARRYPHGALK